MHLKQKTNKKKSNKQLLALQKDAAECKKERKNNHFRWLDGDRNNVLTCLFNGLSRQSFKTAIQTRLFVAKYLGLTV